MKQSKSYLQYLFLFLLTHTFCIFATDLPKLTVILIVDQFAYSQLQRLKPHFKAGLKLLTSDGVRFENAYFPHGMPSTATGHAGLNTGTYAKDHGIVGNRWFDEQGNKVYCDDDSVENAAVFSPDGTYDYGKSAKLMLVDGLSDQFVLKSLPDTPHHAYAISYKGRSAITTASKLGKALWFDGQAGRFTSSKAYFPALPGWVTKFNNKKLKDLKSVGWWPVYAINSPAYAWHNQLTYQFTKNKMSLIGTKIPFKDITQDPGDQYDPFMQTPTANELLLKLSKRCIKEYINKDKPDRMLLWISISGPDKLGHDYGPDSMEVIDMLYHLDKQLETFIAAAQKKVGKDDVLFVLTADHGVSPIPELLQKKGYTAAGRIFPEELIIQMNTLITKKYGVDNLIYNFKNPQFYVNMQKFRALDTKIQNNVINDIKNFLITSPGIKRVWTFDELAARCFEPTSIENYFKQQLYPGRSGFITIQSFPYNIVSKYKTGSGHKTPYEYDTHVPLILYQHGTFEKKVIHQKVWTLQLANTLTRILGIQKPSASTFMQLPGLAQSNNCSALLTRFW